MSEQPHRTFTKFPIAEARASVAGRRHKTPHVPRSLRVNIQATQTARNEELPYDLVFDTVRPRIDFNKPLPPLPDQKLSSRRSSRCETPKTPIDKAAHWVNKKVITPMRELFHTPEVTEMITPCESQSTSMTGHGSHKTRIMEQESPPRSRDSHAFHAEFYPQPQADSDSQSRAKPRVDRQPTPRHSRGSSSSGVSQKPTMAHKSRGSESSMSNSVRTALETGVGTAKDVGNRLRLGHESGRLVFSDSAPPGMMDPCSVCGKEPKGFLYHGKCRDCNQLVNKVFPYGAAPPSDNPMMITDIMRVVSESSWDKSVLNAEEHLFLTSYWNNIMPGLVSTSPGGTFLMHTLEQRYTEAARQTEGVASIVVKFQNSHIGRGISWDGSLRHVRRTELSTSASFVSSTSVSPRLTPSASRRALSVVDPRPIPLD